MAAEEQNIFDKFLQAQIFSGLGPWQSLAFQGAVTPKLLKFTAVNETEEKTLYFASVISREEKMLWQSFEDLLEHSVKLAAAALQGIFCLDVLSADIQQGIRHFLPQDFAALLANHGRLLGLGQRTLIRYGQIFCLLHKRAPADWGKIEVVHHVELVNPEKIRLAGFLNRMVNAGAKEPGAIYLIHDLGLTPAWDLEKEKQDKKLSVDFALSNAKGAVLEATRLK